MTGWSGCNMAHNYQLAATLAVTSLLGGGVNSLKYRKILRNPN